MMLIFIYIHLKIFIENSVVLFLGNAKLKLSADSIRQQLGCKPFKHLPCQQIVVAVVSLSFNSGAISPALKHPKK